MTNHEIARRFQQIGDILEIQGENVFKIRAYRNAVATIADLDDSLEDILARNGLSELPGFGEAIVGKTRDFLTTGTTALWERIKDTVPEGVVAMAAISGIGPKSAKALWDALGITSVAELKMAAKAGRVRTVAGFGEKKEAAILEAIERNRRLNERVPRYIALPAAENYARRLAALPEISRVEIAGELRRGMDTVSHVVLCVESDSPQSDALRALIASSELGINGRSIIIKVPEMNGRSIIIKVLPTADFDLVYELWTGPEELSLLAEMRGFSAAYLAAIPPELRDWPDIIEIAERGELPTLITEADFKGQLHEHSTYSDGSATIREMAEGAIARGYEYLAITDHSYSLRIANGLPRERHLQQLEEIAALNTDYAGRFTILTGIEADILADGSLDCGEDILARLDIVVGSVHIRHKEDEAAMTRRIVTALQNPHLTILGHPTGRLIGRREPYPVNMDAVIEAARANNKVLEINASPDRMDLNDVYAKRAKEAGVKLTINADAHSVAGLGLLSWGLCMARRAGLTKDDVINTYSLPELREWLR